MALKVAILGLSLLTAASSIGRGRGNGVAHPANSNTHTANSELGRSRPPNAAEAQQGGKTEE